MEPSNLIADWEGFCPICEKNTRFTSKSTWFRDNLLCASCIGGSIPRERALMLAIRNVLPNWAGLDIHESSPAKRGVSMLLSTNAAKYVPSQFFEGISLGVIHKGVRCENLEAQSFADNTFDLVVSQDVMEHVFNPEKAYQEIYRTLRPGGYHIHTTPIYKGLVQTQRKAELDENGKIVHLAEPEYHGNPISDEGSLVTFHFGYDLAELITDWTPFDVEIRRYADRTHGVIAEFSEVIICRKPL